MITDKGREYMNNIDELLLTNKTAAQPTPPEKQAEIQPEYDTNNEKNDIEAFENTPDLNDETDSSEHTQEVNDTKEQEESKQKNEHDEYGNEKNPVKTYTEEEVNERINKAVRERLARAEKNNQPQQPTQQPQQKFEYNENSDVGWEQQLEQFVEKTVSNMTVKQHQRQQQQREQAAQAEFEQRFHDGMSKFNDFVDVVGSKPITDAMTVATRAMKDPAAFLYAASKRESKELERISQIPDAYAQMVEMGKLEERMRKNKTPTQAPRPLSKTQEDIGLPENKKRGETIEDLIAESDAKRRRIFNQKRR